MRVRLGLSVAANIPVHVEVGNHAARHELFCHELTGERDALLPGQLARDGKLDLAGELGVTALFSRLDLVPQGRAVAQMLGCTGGQHHLGMDDAGLVREVVMAVEALVMQPRRRAVRGTRHRARAGAAADDLCREVVDRHDGAEITLRPRDVGTTYKRALMR